MTPLIIYVILEIIKGNELLNIEERKINSMTKSLELIIQNIREQLQGLDEETRNEVIDKVLMEDSEIDIFKKIDTTMFEIFRFCKSCIEEKPLPEEPDLIHYDFWLTFAKDTNKFFLENDPYAQNSKFYDEKYGRFDDLAFEYVNETIISEKDYATKILDETGIKNHVTDNLLYHMLLDSIEGYVSEIDAHYNGSVSFIDSILAASQRAIENNKHLLQS